MKILIATVAFAVCSALPVAATAQPLQSIDEFDSEIHLNLDECFDWEHSDRLACFESAVSRCYRFTQDLSTAGGAYYCSYIAFDEIDAKLNETYPAYLAAARNNVRGSDWVAESEEMLRIAQRAWIEYRDAMCEIDASWRAINTGYDAVVSDCMSRLTLMQMETLEAELGGFLSGQ